MTILHKTTIYNALVILGFIVVIISCKSNNRFSETHSTTTNNSITFITGECFGICPVYKFVLPIKGSASFTGRKNVKVIGHSTIEIPQKKVNGIYDQFLELDFKTKIYNPHLRDFPQKKLIYGKDTISLKGTKNVPEELLYLIKKIENTVDQYVLN